MSLGRTRRLRFLFWSCVLRVSIVVSSLGGRAFVRGLKGRSEARGLDSSGRV